MPSESVPTKSPSRPPPRSPAIPGRLGESRGGFLLLLAHRRDRWPQHPAFGTLPAFQLLPQHAPLLVPIVQPHHLAYERLGNSRPSLFYCGQEQQLFLQIGSQL